MRSQLQDCVICSVSAAPEGAVTGGFSRSIPSSLGKLQLSQFENAACTFTF